MSKARRNTFSDKLLRWYRRHGRHDLPWQKKPDPYRIWVSEIMLQQTQVQTVIPYFNRLMQRFPTVADLARASLDQVLTLWTGLGYYARARNLHRSAILIRDQWGGQLPDEREALETLPGIGRSTAAAILALSRNQPHAILDGNVKRVLARYHAVPGWPGRKPVQDRLWELAERHTPVRATAAYTQAIMDLGATICTRSSPDCGACPVATGCEARRQGQQQAYPERKTSRPKPVRQTCFAILEDDRGCILLQRRPPAGIWGGLWSFPECPVDEDVAAWIKQSFGSTVSDLCCQEWLSHTFSHFQLDILPVRAVLRDTPSAVREQPDIYWVTPGEDLSVGVAAPVKKIIQSL